MSTSTKGVSPKHSLAERLNRSRRHRQWANSQLDSASVGAASISSAGNASTNSEPAIATTPHQKLRARAPLSIAQSPSGDIGSVDSGTTPSPEKRETLASRETLATRRARAMHLQKKRGAFSPQGQPQQAAAPPNKPVEASKSAATTNEVFHHQGPAAQAFKPASVPVPPSTPSSQPRNHSKQPMSSCESVQYQANEMDSHRADNDSEDVRTVSENRKKPVSQPNQVSSAQNGNDKFRGGPSFLPVVPSSHFSKAPPPAKAAVHDKKHSEVSSGQTNLKKPTPHAPAIRYSTGNIHNNANQSHRSANQSRSSLNSLPAQQNSEKVEGFNGSVIETPQSASVARLRASFNGSGSDKPLMPMNSPDPRIRHSIGLVGPAKVPDRASPDQRPREAPGRTVVNERGQTARTWQKPSANGQSFANRPSWQNRDAQSHVSSVATQMPHGPPVTQGQRTSWQSRPAPQVQTGTSIAANATPNTAPWRNQMKAPKTSWQSHKIVPTKDDSTPSQPASWQNRPQQSVGNSSTATQRTSWQNRAPPTSDMQRMASHNVAPKPSSASRQDRPHGANKPVESLTTHAWENRNMQRAPVTPPKEQVAGARHGRLAGASSPVVMPPMDQRHEYRSKEETEQHSRQQYDDWRSQNEQAVSSPDAQHKAQQDHLRQNPSIQPSPGEARNVGPKQSLPPVILPQKDLPKKSLPPAILPTTGLSAKSLPPVILPQKGAPRKPLPPVILPQAILPPKSLPPAILPQTQPAPSRPLAPAILPQNGNVEKRLLQEASSLDEPTDPCRMLHAEQQQRSPPSEGALVGGDGSAKVTNGDCLEEVARGEALLELEKSGGTLDKPPIGGDFGKDPGEGLNEGEKILSHPKDESDYVEEKKSGEDIVPSGGDDPTGEVQEPLTHLARMAADSTLIADYEEAIKHASKGVSYDEEDESYISGGLTNSASALPHYLPPEFEQALAGNHTVHSTGALATQGAVSGARKPEEPSPTSPPQSSPDSGSRYPRLSPSLRDNEAYRSGYYGDDGKQLRRVSPPKDHRRHSQGELSPTKDHVARYQESLSVRAAATHNSAPIQYFDHGACGEQASYESPLRSPHTGQGYLSSDYSASVDDSNTDASNEQTPMYPVSSLDEVDAGRHGGGRGSHVVFGDPNSFGAAGVGDGGLSPSIRRRGTAIENWRGGRETSQVPKSHEREGKSSEKRKASASQILKFWASGAASEEEQEEAEHFQDTEEWADRDPEIDGFRDNSPPPSPNPESHPSYDSRELSAVKGWRQASTPSTAALGGALKGSPTESTQATPISKDPTSRSTLRISGSNDRSDAKSRKSRSKRPKEVFDPFGGADDLRITDSSDLFSPLPDPFMTEESFSPPVWDSPRGRDTVQHHDDSSPEWDSQAEI